MAKDNKTNVMRILDKKKVSYEPIFYECEEFIDGIHVADKTGVPREQSFKTLTAKGKSGGFYVFVIPIEKEVDLKKAAKAVGEKSVEMLHVKELLSVTGYVRGGCSPIGMKKHYPTVIHSSVLEYDAVYVSGGKIGTTVKLSPQDLIAVCDAKAEDIIAN